MNFKTTPSASVSAGTLALGRTSGFVWFVRGGFVARGLVYGLIGGLALALALGAANGSATNQQGAFSLIARAPLGGLALGIIALGVLAYASWQIGQAVLARGLERGGRASTRDRLGHLASGVGYLGLFLLAVKVLLGTHSHQQAGARHAAAGVLGWPGGQWLVGLAGVAFVAICLYQAYKGLKGSYLDDMKTEQMSRDVRRFLGHLGRIGVVSRALIFALIGYFLIRTAIDYDVTKVIGIDGALREVARHAYGAWLLGLSALGLMTFAAASFAEARYHRL